ncbi:BaiN/RdsA family NAD(P)/FAD-dependent oxidoreductase [Hymenobacter weizhouensis]|uniref:NAD(P)/FAD-dependent oxidoreductase n=1 Tax=Hymenobacter sp. YIM 151500-1 TaxID=2987689 RepID=UPI0022279E61|nr:TIGR03862 family flavoprotein [Hymenobacter sp. YIM 151500-1]UYZ63851.1 TIGR03862 family flavoprotein [Hymenobacter sp. YIM 151500-1]
MSISALAGMGPEVAVVGGGPAGLLAAEHLARAGCRVTVYEAQATVGRKFLVAGHGGFNLTHGEPLPTFQTRYAARQPEFARFLAHFSPEHLRQWAQELGIGTFVGTSGRVFPQPEHKPAHLLRAWLNRLAGLGVSIRTRHRWLGFDGPRGLRLLDEATGAVVTATPAAAVLALGGASWPKTGSDGRWTGPLAELGVRLEPFAPSNCGAEVAWSAFFREKVGRQPLKNVALSCGGRTVPGEIMLTDYGLEGTPVYALTPELRQRLAAGSPAWLHLNLKPMLPPEQLRARLHRRRLPSTLTALLKDVFRLGPPAPTLLRELTSLPANLPPPDAVVSALTALPIPVTGLRPLAEAISTAGGVAWDEVDDHLMLRRRPGTFLAGEMLDWEAPTGGYLLQGCFSTGAWAAHGALAWLFENEGNVGKM